MNYISVIYCIFACIIGIDWISRGRLQYRYKLYEELQTDYESGESLVRYFHGSVIIFYILANND